MPLDILAEAVSGHITKNPRRKRIVEQVRLLLQSDGRIRLEHRSYWWVLTLFFHAVADGWLCREPGVRLGLGNTLDSMPFRSSRYSLGWKARLIREHEEAMMVKGQQLTASEKKMMATAEVALVADFVARVRTMGSLDCLPQAKPSRVLTRGKTRKNYVEGAARAALAATSLPPSLGDEDKRRLVLADLGVAADLALTDAFKRVYHHGRGSMALAAALTKVNPYINMAAAEVLIESLCKERRGAMASRGGGPLEPRGEAGIRVLPKKKKKTSTVSMW